MKVKLTREQRIHVLNSTDVYKVMQDILLRENKIGRSKEHIWVVCLSNSNRILLIELISLGTSKRSVVDPTELYSFALQKRALKVIMVHNHPSGLLIPSEDDRDVTDRMFQVGLFLDVPLIDHLIISEKEYYSFVDSGLLAKIARSSKYVLKYKKEVERIKKIGRKEGEFDKAIKMAKIMKNDGKTTEEIMRYTKLSKKQIDKL
jgi:DNA repair protein RadC